MNAEAPASPAGRDWLAWGALGLMMVAMGSSFGLNQLALQGMSPFAVTAWRLIISALCLLAVTYAIGQPLLWQGRFWAWCAAYGVIGFAAPFCLMTWGQSFLPSNVAAIYFAAIPLLLLVLSTLFLGVRITRRKLAGIVVGTFGLLYLAGPGTFVVASTSSIWPQIALLAAVVLLACTGLVIRLMPRYPPMAAIAAATVVGALVTFPLTVTHAPAAMPGPVALAGLLGVGIVSTTLAQSLRFFLIRRKGPVFLIPNSYGSTLFAAALGWIALGEVMAWQTIVAFVLITLAVIASEDGSGHMKQA